MFDFGLAADWLIQIMGGFKKQCHLLVHCLIQMSVDALEVQGYLIMYLLIRQLGGIFTITTP